MSLLSRKPCTPVLRFIGLEVVGTAGRERRVGAKSTILRPFATPPSTKLTNLLDHAGCFSKFAFSWFLDRKPVKTVEIISQTTILQGHLAHKKTRAPLGPP